jgi:hypothetical protein
MHSTYFRMTSPKEQAGQGCLCIGFNCMSCAALGTCRQVVPWTSAFPSRQLVERTYWLKCELFYTWSCLGLMGKAGLYR